MTQDWMNPERRYTMDLPENRSVDSVSNFVDVIATMKVSEGLPVVYRGHGKSSYKLEPFLFRNEGHRENEAEMMRSVFAAQPEAFTGDGSTFDKLVRTQHFGLPTRLMDVSWTPLVALFFCCTSHLDFRGEVVVMGWEPSRTKFFDSDTVSILANLSYLTRGERSKMSTPLAPGVDTFNNVEGSKRLLHFIKDEKPYFQGIIKPKDVWKPLLVRPKHSNKRIVAQNGAFILFGFDRVLASPSSDDIALIRKISVPAKAKAKILKELDLLGINDQSLFPELERSAKYVAQKFFRASPKKNRSYKLVLPLSSIGGVSMSTLSGLRRARSVRR